MGVADHLRWLYGKGDVLGNRYDAGMAGMRPCNADEQQDAIEAQDFMYAAYAPNGPGWTANEIEAFEAEQERKEAVYGRPGRETE